LRLFNLYEQRTPGQVVTVS